MSRIKKKCPKFNPLICEYNIHWKYFYFLLCLQEFSKNTCHFCRLFLEVRKVKFWNFFLFNISYFKTKMNIIIQKNFQFFLFLTLFWSCKKFANSFQCICIFLEVCKCHYITHNWSVLVCIRKSVDFIFFRSSQVGYL